MSLQSNDSEDKGTSQVPAILEGLQLAHFGLVAHTLVSYCDHKHDDVYGLGWWARLSETHHSKVREASFPRNRSSGWVKRNPLQSRKNKLATPVLRWKEESF